MFKNLDQIWAMWIKAAYSIHYTINNIKVTLVYIKHQATHYIRRRTVKYVYSYQYQKFELNLNASKTHCNRLGTDSMSNLRP